MLQLRIVALALVLLLPASLVAQRGAPSNVRVSANGTVVTVSWTPPDRGLRYRVLRGVDPRVVGHDISGLLTATSFDDIKAAPGTTFFYQVIAYDGTVEAAAAPVAFLVPIPPPSATPGQPLVPIGGVPGGRMPTTVSGISVTGTLASATVSWQPVAGATSYTVTRTKPTGGVEVIPGILTTLSGDRLSWTDAGPLNLGFTAAGVYLYKITAMLEGGSVSGQTSWTRPNPTCAPPDPNKFFGGLNPPPATFMDGPYPSGAYLNWGKPTLPHPVAYRVERSPQGSNGWMVAATSCQGLSPTGTGFSELFFVDGLPGIVPGTTYDYRLTAIAATGDWGATTTSWTAPGPVILRWRSASIAGGKITLNMRYEPPMTNVPALPRHIRFTGPNGLNIIAPINACRSLNGCSILADASTGNHHFTVTAEWGVSNSTPVLARVTADTVVVVP